MRLLITGASGLLGINLALELARGVNSLSGKVEDSRLPEGLQVFGVVNSRNLFTREFEVLAVDLLAPGAIERLLDKTQPDWIIHCAALANVDECENNPELARRMNSELPRKLASLVARGGARLVHISTDAVFDGQRGGYDEADEPNPLGMYARTKLEGEQGVAEANPEAVIARVNLFGWSLTGKRSLAEHFIYSLQAGKSVMGFKDVYFCPLVANDLAWLFVKMLQARLNGLYHVVSPECMSKLDFGLALARRFGLDESLIRQVSVKEAGLKAARSPQLTLRSEKLSNALGEPLPTVSTGIEKLYTLYQQGYPQHLRAMASLPA